MAILTVVLSTSRRPPSGPLDTVSTATAPAGPATISTWSLPGFTMNASLSTSLVTRKWTPSWSRYHVDIDGGRILVHVLDVVLCHRQIHPAGSNAVNRAKGDVAVTGGEDALLRLEPTVGKVDLLDRADLAAAGVVHVHTVLDC